MSAPGPVILAANHRDNLDGPLLLHVVRARSTSQRGRWLAGICALLAALGAFPPMHGAYGMD
jgi:hypothetical protein